MHSTKLTLTKVQQLFNSLTRFSAEYDTKQIFNTSGMVNEFACLEYGFFPLGSGILTEKSKIENAEIENCEVMVLGNDFGTRKYLEKGCPDGKESNSRTIRNLENIGLKLENTFFTNFYLGLRDNIKFPKMTMTELAVERSSVYQKYCFDFFKIQLSIMNPKIIICLGKQVGFALNNSVQDIFSAFENKNMLLSKLYTNESKPYIINYQGTNFGKRIFIFIPHPSYAHINWSRNGIKEKIITAIQNRDNNL